MHWWWPWLGLAGCPYIWQPPELANPVPDARDDADSDADADADSDSDADSDADTDPHSADTQPTGGSGSTADTAVPEPPSIQGLEVHLRSDHIEIRFELSDPDGDLDGGTLAWSEDGIGQPDIAIPTGLDTWDPHTGVGTVVARSITRDCGTDPLAFDYTLVPSDASGLVGVEVATSIAITVVPDAVDYGNLKTITAPAIICSAFINKDAFDEFEFIHQPGGSWQITLDHDQVGLDVDALIHDGAPVVTVSSSNPTASAVLVAGGGYFLEVNRNGWDPIQNYVVTFHE